MVSWFPFGFIVSFSAKLSSRENRKGRSRFGSVKFLNEKVDQGLGRLSFFHEKLDQDLGQSFFFHEKIGQVF